MKVNKQNGFTLLEVLIALLVFAVGLLGVLDSSVRSTRISMDNNARAMMSSIASQQLEPLYIFASKVSAGTKTKDEFIAALSAVNNTTVYNTTIVDSNNKKQRDAFTIKLLKAVDNNDNDALTVANVESPVRAVFELSYDGLSGTKTTKLNYTFVW